MSGLQAMTAATAVAPALATRGVIAAVTGHFAGCGT
jgi:hypothetical protein